MTIHTYYSYPTDIGYPSPVYPSLDSQNLIYSVKSEDNLTDSHSSDLDYSNSFYSDSVCLDPIYSNPVGDPDPVFPVPSENLNDDYTHSPSSIDSELYDHSTQLAHEHMTAKSRYWSQKEVQKLKELRKKYGPDWETISSEILDRTPIQCANKWGRDVWPKMSEEERLEYKKHYWTCEEDTQLMDLVKSYGTMWKVIAPFFLDKKTPNACSLHWYKIILPQIPEEDRHEYESDRISWSDQEKEHLSELVSQHGDDDWNKISLLTGKSPAQCKLMWRCMNIDVSNQSKPIEWTKELEEKLLTTANKWIRMNGTYQWKEIAISFGGIKTSALKSKLVRIQNRMNIADEPLKAPSTNIKKIRRKNIRK